MKALIPEFCSDLISKYISAGYFTNESDAVDAFAGAMDSTSVKSDVESNFGEDIADWMFNTTRQWAASIIMRMKMPGLFISL